MVPRASRVPHLCKHVAKTALHCKTPVVVAKMCCRSTHYLCSEISVEQEVQMGDHTQGQPPHGDYKSPLCKVNDAGATYIL